MKVLDVASLQTGIAQTMADIETKQTQIEAVQRAVRDFHSLDGSLEGQGGDAIRGFYKDTHEPFLIYLHQTLTNYKQALKATSEAIHSFESHSDGYVSQDFLLNDVKEGYDQVGDKAKTLADEANHIIDSVQDIVYIKRIDETEVMDSVTKGKDEVDKISDQFIEADKEGASRLEETQDDLKTMQTFLSEMSTKFTNSASISSYSIASTREMSALHTMKDEVYDKGVLTTEVEKAKEARDSVLKNLNASSSRNIINKAYQEFKNGEIKYAEYFEVLNGVKNTSGDMNKNKLKEESTEEFIKYLKDHQMLNDYLDDHQVLAQHIELKEKEAKLAEQDPELQIIVKKAWEDFKDGILDYESYKSLVSGTLHGGGAFLSNLVNSKFTEKISGEAARRLTDWWKHNTVTFMDKGLTLAFAHGGDIVIRETPSKLAKVLRTGAKYSPKAIGSLIDFGSQVLTGEDVGDAAIKTTGHAAAGAAGFAIGSFIPVPLVGSAIGFAAGVGLSMAFDWAYDNGLKEGINKVGEAVTGFFSNIGSVFS